MKLSLLIFFTLLSVTLSDKSVPMGKKSKEKDSSDGPLLQPQKPECRTICKDEGRVKICGEQMTPPKNGNSTVTLYNNACEMDCDRAKEIDIKICKYEKPKRNHARRS